MILTKFRFPPRVLGRLDVLFIREAISIAGDGLVITNFT